MRVIKFEDVIHLIFFNLLKFIFCYSLNSSVTKEEENKSNKKIKNIPHLSFYFFRPIPFYFNFSLPHGREPIVHGAYVADVSKVFSLIL